MAIELVQCERDNLITSHGCRFIAQNEVVLSLPKKTNQNYYKKVSCVGIVQTAKR